jgi:hypothetical protein
MTEDQQDIIDIPLPQDADDTLDAAASLDIVVEDISPGEGHFAVDYRRC